MCISIKNAMFCWRKINKDSEGPSFTVIEHPDYGHLSDIYRKTDGANYLDWKEKDVCNKKPFWYMSPHIDFDGRAFGYVQIEHEFLSKPATPTKIRFWRYAE